MHFKSLHFHSFIHSLSQCSSVCKSYDKLRSNLCVPLNTHCSLSVVTCQSSLLGHGHQTICRRLTSLRHAYIN